MNSLLTVLWLTVTAFVDRAITSKRIRDGLEAIPSPYSTLPQPNPGAHQKTRNQIHSHTQMHKPDILSECYKTLEFLANWHLPQSFNEKHYLPELTASHVFIMMHGTFYHHLLLLEVMFCYAQHPPHVTRYCIYSEFKSNLFDNKELFWHRRRLKFCQKKEKIQ